MKIFREMVFSFSSSSSTVIQRLADLKKKEETKDVFIFDIAGLRVKIGTYNIGKKLPTPVFEGYFEDKTNGSVLTLKNKYSVIIKWLLFCTIISAIFSFPLKENGIQSFLVVDSIFFALCIIHYVYHFFMLRQDIVLFLDSDNGENYLEPKYTSDY